VIFDLSVVTDTLKKLVDSAWPNAPLWTQATPQFAVDVTGLSPEAARAGQGAQLSLYLYHIDENKAQGSLFWAAQSQSAGGPPVQYQPLALDLYYLLSAYAEGSYVHEQQAMSIAMRVFHENPVVRGASPDGTQWEVTLTLERRSYDELSRLWQATTSALRLSAVYRAAVVLIEPEPGLPPAPKPSVIDLAVEPGVATGSPQLMGAHREVRYTVPGGTAVTVVQDPATVAAGGEVWLIGTDLGGVTTQQLILTGPYPGSTEADVSGWLTDPQSAVATRRVVQLPAVAQRAGQRHRVAGQQGALRVRVILPPGGRRELQQQRRQRAERDQRRQPRRPGRHGDVAPRHVRQFVRDDSAQFLH